MQEVCTDIKDIDLSRVEMTYRTNILSIFAMTKFALPHMSRGSSIINSGSVAGYMGNPESQSNSKEGWIVSSLRPKTGVYCLRPRYLYILNLKE